PRGKLDVLSDGRDPLRSGPLPDASPIHGGQLRTGGFHVAELTQRELARVVRRHSAGDEVFHTLLEVKAHLVVDVALDGSTGRVVVEQFAWILVAHIEAALHPLTRCRGS